MKNQFILELKNYFSENIASRDAIDLVFSKIPSKVQELSIDFKDVVFITDIKKPIF